MGWLTRSRLRVLEDLDQFVPSSDWKAWGIARQSTLRGPLYGLDNLIRFSRHEGAAIIRCVAPGRSVLAWRPTNHLLQTAITRTWRPRVILGQSIIIPASAEAGLWLVITGETITNQGRHILVPNAELQVWLDAPGE